MRTRCKLIGVLSGVGFLLGGNPSSRAQVLEDRTPTGGSNIVTRKCIGGADAGTRCKANAECDSGECFPYNVVDLTVNIVDAAGNAWTPTAAQMTNIRNNFIGVGDAVFDVTDGQVAIGTIALVVANGAPNAVVKLSAGMCQTGLGPCTVDADCGAGDVCQSAGGVASTGNWGNSGTITVGIGCIRNGYCFAHEFIHLWGNARDEYEGALDDGMDNNGNGTIDECGENQSFNRCFGGAQNGQNCDGNAALCTAPGACQQMGCIVGAANCLMETASAADELCVPMNHDPDIDTEQSQCRNNNACWTQVGISWPSLITPPAGLPDPGPAMAPFPVTFIEPAILDRFVAIVDRSDSMNSESPSRIQLAVNAVRDFVDLLSVGSEFGLASFASADGGDPDGVDSTKDFPGVAGLRAIAGDADRTDAKDAADGLVDRAAGFTRIGAGLRQARDMLLEAGGAISINTSVLLLTDGINNRPEGSAQADLDAALQEMRDAGLSVFVSCIGEARDSVQCSNIADQTSGRFVDSANTANLYDAFVEFVAMAEGDGIAQTEMEIPIQEGDVSDGIPVVVEEGAVEARFVASWTNPDNDLDLLLFRPDGSQVSASERVIGSQGEFYRIDMPDEGTWILRVEGVSVDGTELISARGIVDHQQLNFSAGLARSAITWPSPFVINAHPSISRSIEGCEATAEVRKPDGTSELVALDDEGSFGEDEHDGLYLASFKNFTAGDGIYTFLVRIRCEAGTAHVASHFDPGVGQFPLDPEVPTFERTLRFSGTVTGVPDNLPPTAVICRDVRAECAGELTSVMLDGTCSFDPEGGELDYLWTSPTGIFEENDVAQPTAAFPLGRNTVVLEVRDPEDVNSEKDFGLVVIADTTAPVIESIVAVPDELWPPNHRMVPVTLTVDVSDVCDSEPVCSISGVESNEPVNGRGDGNTAPDWELTGALTLNLRSERAGNGTGRVYTIRVNCSDASGNASTDTVAVTVPHDQGP